MRISNVILYAEYRKKINVYAINKKSLSIWLLLSEVIYYSSKRANGFRRIV